jgi:hypothetical protein
VNAKKLAGQCVAVIQTDPKIVSQEEEESI